MELPEIPKLNFGTGGAKTPAVLFIVTALLAGGVIYIALKGKADAARYAERK